MDEIILAPFSNSALRDWPHYGALTALLLERTDYKITIVGAASQRVITDSIVRPFPADRVENTAGRLAWGEVIKRVRSAALMVANNSGMAHIAAEFGTPTICIFGASHSPYEWMARGPRTTVILKETVCSPCGFDVVSNCQFGVRCLSEIDAETVFDICMARVIDARPDNSDLPVAVEDVLKEDRANALEISRTKTEATSRPPGRD